MTKDFDGWNKKKQEIDAQIKPPFFSEGQIWWCSVGLNVGYEILGKSVQYSRPVFIMRKYTHSTFFGIPLTTKRKDRASYYNLEFNGKQGSVILDQGRTLDARRLKGRIGELPEPVCEDIRQAFFKYH
ncbi:MAG: type II toxin-antitoxin system PemK/MazF family toxin [Rickettsiales bacterium]